MYHRYERMSKEAQTGMQQQAAELRLARRVRPQARATGRRSVLDGLNRSMRMLAQAWGRRMPRLAGR
jgi:hypothetical protein